MMASTLLLAKQRADYRFRPMVSSDLAMVRTWLSEPHVRHWWGEPDEQFALGHRKSHSAINRAARTVSINSSANPI